MTGTNVGASKESRRAESRGQQRRQVGLVDVDGPVQRQRPDRHDRLQFRYDHGRVHRQQRLVADDWWPATTTAAGIYTSKVTFNAVAGTSYQIAVDGYNYGSGAASGNITLHVSLATATALQPPANVATTVSHRPVQVTWTASANATAMKVTEHQQQPWHGDENQLFGRDRFQLQRHVCTGRDAVLVLGQGEEPQRDS